MKRKLNIILLLLLLFQQGISYSQQTCILAGDETLGRYTDLIPDENISYDFTNHPSVYELDLNNDLTPDFIFRAYYHYSAWVPYWRFSIEGTGVNKIFLNPDHPSAPDTLKIDEPFCSTGLWQSLGYFVNNTGSMYDSTGWWNVNTGDRCVGLILSNGVDSTYGWVRVVYDAGTLIIKDHALGFFPLPEEGVILFPNPSEEFVWIYLPDSFSVPYTIQLYNSRGDIVYENYGNEKKVDVHAMPSGIYVFRLITKDKTISQKIVITKKK